MVRAVLLATLLLLAVGCLVLSVGHFRQKGLLWNNAWLFASQRERQTMDKAPHYRQSAVVFALLALLFVLLAAQVFWEISWFLYLEGAVIAGVLVYAMVSSVRRR